MSHDVTEKIIHSKWKKNQLKKSPTLKMKLFFQLKSRTRTVNLDVNLDLVLAVILLESQLIWW